MKFHNMITGLFFCLFGQQIAATDITGDFMLDLIVKYMLECSGAQFDFDSCLVRNVAETLLYLDDSSAPQNRRLRRLSRLSHVLNSKKLDLKKKFLDARDMYKHKESHQKEPHQRLLSGDADNTNTTMNITVGHGFSTSESMSAAPSSVQTAAVSGTESSSAAPSPWGRNIFDDDHYFIANFTDYNGTNDDTYNDDYYYYDEQCLPYSEDELPFLKLMLQEQLGYLNEACEEKGEGDSSILQDTYENVVKVLEARECLESTCDESFPIKLVGWHFETCAGISLPFASHIDTPSLEEQKEDAMLGCMINMAMFVPKEYFGIDTATLTEEEHCYPPQYQYMESFCPSQLGPMVLQMCAYMPYEDMGMDNEFYDPSRNEIYLNKFCSFATEVSSPTGRECLLPLCEWAGDMMKDQAPDRPVTSSWSSSSSPYSSESSSSSASAVPTAVPTKHPTASPTRVPTRAPTNTPTNVPTNAPTTKSPIDVSKKYAKAEFNAGLMLNNLEAEDIPTSGPELKAVVTLLSDVISESLSNDSTSTVIILSIAGIPVHGIQVRRLNAPDGVEVKFKVIIELLCAETCAKATTDVAKLYEDVSNNIESSVEDGTLGAKIIDKAEAMDVTIFNNVTIDSFTAENAQFTIIDGEGNEVNDDDIPSDDDDSSSASMNVIYSKVFTCLLALGLMALGLAL